MIRIHLDTDLGSDTDDLCALAMVLGWPGVELAGITTVSDPGGIRAGFVRRALELARREDVPVAAGAEGPLGELFVPLEFPDYWGGPVPPRPSPPGAALDTLDASIRSGARVVAIGPFTNLAMFEAARPGRLAEAGVTVMGGWVTPPRAGLPAWTWEQDFNVQQDAPAAKVVFDRCRPLVVQVAVTLEVWLRRAHLPPLLAGGPLARLLADQAERHAADQDVAAMARELDGLPDDLLNFQYDALACAVACGWDGVRIEEVGLTPELEAGRLRLVLDHGGAPLPVVTAVDGERFADEWLAAVLAASAAASRRTAG